VAFAFAGVEASVVGHFSLFSRRLTFSFIQARDSGVGPTVGVVAGLSPIDEGSERGVGDGRSSFDCYWKANYGRRRTVVCDPRPWPSTPEARRRTRDLNLAWSDTDESPGTD